jgi:hypothetical protein
VTPRPLSHDEARAVLRACPDDGRVSALRITAANDLYIAWTSGSFEVLWTAGVRAKVHEPNLTALAERIRAARRDPWYRPPAAEAAGDNGGGDE